MPDPYDPAVDAAERGLLSASCLAPSQLAELRARPFLTVPVHAACSVSELAADPAMRAFFADGTHGLPIDLVEPDALAPQGDRLPCHLFMPEVAWPAALPPVLRTPRRELYLLRVEPWAPAWPAVDDLDDETWNRIMFVVLVGVCLAALVYIGVLS